MNLLSSILGVVGGGLNSALGLVTSTMQSGFQTAIQFHKEGIAFARDVGLSARQAQAYTNVLIERTQVLANKYGVSAEAIMQVQRGLSEATGKQLMLNDAQAESFVQIDKMMGAQNRVKFTEEIMNGMGGQVDTVSNAMAKVYATAAKQGLNAKKLSDKVAQNLSMANRLSFRNGIDGITRMAALSEKLGINMQSVETAAGQFMELDKAIENAAQMQMLGGSAAANFGNPLTAAYEANYDPEAFAQRMSDSLASYATFDASKGVASINGMNMDFVRNIAKTMGISVDDASKMAKKQAEVKYKEAQFTPQLNGLGLTEDQKNFIINNAQVTNGGKDLQLNGMSMSDLAANPKKLQEMMDFEGMSDKEILQDQAIHLKSIDEAMTGAQTQVAASFAKGIQEHMNPLIEQIENLGKTFSTYAEQWGNDAGKVLGDVLGWVNGHKEEISTAINGILSGITKVIDFLSGGGLYRVLAAVIGYKALKGILGMSVGGGTTVGGRAASGAAKGLKNIGSRLYKGSPADWFKQTYQWSRNVGNPNRVGKFKALGGALKDSWKGASKFAKGTTIAGAAFGAIEGATALMDYSTKKKQLKEQLDRGEISQKEYDSQVNEARGEKNEKLGGAIGGTLGTAIGTFFGGPIGGMIAGYLGDKVGSFIGKHWDGITKKISNAWNGAIDWIGNKGKKVIEGIGNKFSEWGESVSGWWTSTAAPAISEKWEGIKEGAKSLGSSIQEKLKSVFDGETWNKVRASSKVNPFTGLITELIEFVKGPKEYIQNAKNGFKNIIKTITSFPEMVEQWLYDFTKDKKWLPTLGVNHREAQEKHAEGGFINTGAVGVESPVLAQKGEVILNPTQQRNFMTLANDYSKVITNNAFGKNTSLSSLQEITRSGNVTYYNANNANTSVLSVLPKTAEVTAKPVGEKEYVYTPRNNETSNIGNNTVTVKDFNINLSGTLKLDAGNTSKNIDMNALLNDYQFMNALKEMIKQSINSDMNGGRFMNDLATLRGQVSSSSIIGR